MSIFYQPGRYRCEVTQQAIVKATTGTPMFVLKVTVLERYVAPDEVEPCVQQYERTIRRAINENTMRYLQKDLDVLGFTGSSLRELDPRNQGGHQSFVGVLLDCACAAETDKQSGDQREKWSLAWGRKASEEITGDAPTAGEFRALDALFGKAKGASTKTASKVQKQAAPVAAGEEWSASDDDLPF